MQSKRASSNLFQYNTDPWSNNNAGATAAAVTATAAPMTQAYTSPTLPQVTPVYQDYEEPAPANHAAYYYNEQQDEYPKDGYHQDVYHHDAYNQEPYNQEPYNQEPYNQEPYNQEGGYYQGHDGSQAGYNDYMYYDQQQPYQQPYSQQQFNDNYSTGMSSHDAYMYGNNNNYETQSAYNSKPDARDK